MPILDLIFIVSNLSHNSGKFNYEESTFIVSVFNWLNTLSNALKLSNIDWLLLNTGK